MMQLFRFVAELSRRRVLRLAGYYLIGAWVVLQVADVTFEPLGVPPWAMRYLVYLVAFGFILALILGWRYDISDAGLVRAGSTHRLSRGDHLTIAGLSFAAFALATLLFAQFRHGSTPPLPMLDSGVHSRVVALSAVAGRAEATHFLAGIVDELSHALSHLDGVTVLAEPSVRILIDRGADACDTLDPPDGCQLAFIEGALGGSGGQWILRVVDVATGTAIETRSVAADAGSLTERVEQLCAEILDATNLASLVNWGAVCAGLVPQTTEEALALYYHGLGQLVQATLEGTLAAKDSFSAAAKADPNFAQAHSGLAVALLELVEHPGYPLSSVRQAARRAAFSARDLAPGHWRTNAALGNWYARTGDFQAAAEAYGKAVGARGGSASLLRRLARIHEALDDSTRALDVARRLYRLDGLNPDVNLEIGSLALRLEDFALAGSALTNTVRVDPDIAAAHSKLGDLNYAQGRCDEAEAEYRLGTVDDPDDVVLFSPENLDFETGLDPWTPHNESFDFDVDTAIVFSGSQSARIGKDDAGDREYGGLSQTIRPCSLQGSRVRLSAHARTLDVENEFAFYITARALPRHFETNRGRVLATDFMEDREISGTTDWTEHELFIDIPAGTAYLSFGAGLRGPGTAWIDNVRLVPVDDATPLTE